MMSLRSTHNVLNHLNTILSPLHICRVIFYFL